MAEITVASFDQIAVLLSKLATNYSNLFVDYETLFYSDVPADVTIQIYNAEGKLETFTIPNRAKDRRFILNGEGSPEGVVTAAKGAIYQDLTSGQVYLKQVGSDTRGWYSLVSESSLNELLRQGESSPEGYETATLGTLYVDKSKGALYVKTTSTGSTGWTLVTANTSILASTELDNLSEEGEAHFANPSLSNLNNIGQALINSKENVDSKVTSITASSTNIQYPSAKAVYTLSYNSTKDLANKDLNNLTETGEEHFLGKPQTRDCILYAPNGVLSVSTNIFTIPAKTVLLVANGFDSNKCRKQTRKVLSSSVSVSVGWTTAKKGYVFLKYNTGSNTPTLMCIDEAGYIRSTATPTGSVQMMWYNPSTNYYKYSTNSGSTWTQVNAVEIGTFITNSSGDVTSITPYYPLAVATQEDVSTQVNTINTNIESILQTIYPVGSIYLSVTNTCPVAAILGTWEKIGTSLLADVNSNVPIRGTGATLGLNNNGSAEIRYLNLYRSSYNEAILQPGSVRGNVYVTTNSDSSGIVGTISKSNLTVNIWKRTA